jgi:ribosomal protein L37AE/L43A
MTGPTYRRCDGIFDIEVQASPLPICPKCNETKTISANDDATHHPQWNCKSCQISFGYDNCPVYIRGSYACR